MDINYLFKRQQIETSMAHSAASQEARDVHQRLARLYEQQIERATAGLVKFPMHYNPRTMSAEQR